jgi:hypothetical protein
MDNDGTAVPITSAQDAQSSDEDEDMDRDDDDGEMQCEDNSGAAQVTISCGHDAMRSGSSCQKAGPVIDDDGFQLVQRGRRR